MTRRSFYNDACEYDPCDDHTYEYPTIDDDDDTIGEFVEACRHEFYDAWMSYVRDFE